MFLNFDIKFNHQVQQVEIKHHKLTILTLVIYSNVFLSLV